MNKTELEMLNESLTWVKDKISFALDPGLSGFGDEEKAEHLNALLEIKKDLEEEIKELYGKDSV
jgi:hypothetical protein